MIFDWIENSIVIDQKGILSHEDKWDKRHSYQQQESYVYYLQQQGMPMNEIRKKWLKIMLKSDQDFRYLTEYDREEEFETLFLKTTDLPAEFTTKKERIIELTKDEIAKIGSLEAPRWFRKYVLLILGWYKFEQSYWHTPYFPKEISSWAYEKAREGENVSQERIHRNLIWEQNARCGHPIKVKPQSGKVALIIPWAHVADAKTPIWKLAGSFITPDDLTSFFDLVPPWTAICPKCGSEFEVSNKTKDALCPACKKAKANERNKANRQKALKKEQNSSN
jgi:hypothetical protein